MTTDNNAAQPVAGAGVPERRIAPYIPAPIPEDFPQRIYIRTRYASDAMGGVYHLERNERDMIEFVRATPTDVDERARRVARRLDDAGYIDKDMVQMRGSCNVGAVVVDIIAAEFQD